MKEHGITDEHERLTAIVNKLKKITPQCLQKFRSETQKIRHLCSAVFDYHWSGTPLSNIVLLKYSINQFVTALHTKVNLNEEKEAHLKHRVDQIVLDNTCFGQYAYNPRLLRNRNRKTNLKKHGKECYKCGYCP